MSVTAKDIEKALCEHYASIGKGYGDKWICLPEISLGKGRLDLIAIKTSYNEYIHGFEIKVSKSDFHNDVNSGKYKKYLAVCDDLTFVVPKGLVAREECPPECGLMTFNEENGKLHKFVKNPLRHMNDRREPLTPQQWMQVLFRAYSVYGAETEELLKKSKKYREIERIAEENPDWNKDIALQDKILSKVAGVFNSTFYSGSRQRAIEELERNVNDVVSLLKEIGFRSDSYGDNRLGILYDAKKQLRKVAVLGRSGEIINTMAMFIRRLSTGSDLSESDIQEIEEAKSLILERNKQKD